MMNAVSRIYANRQPQGPSYNYDTRISSQQQVPVPGGVGGILMMPGVSMPSMDTGRSGLTLLAMGVLTMVGFNIWTHSYQA